MKKKDEEELPGRSYEAKREDIKDIKVKDVIPLNIGVDNQGMMHVVIKKNTNIPCEGQCVGTTSYKDQASIDIDVYEGIFDLTERN